MADDVVGEYYFNTRTQMVERGKLSAWEHLMGPYATYRDAEQALELAATRSAEWDDDEAAWEADDLREDER